MKKKVSKKLKRKTKKKMTRKKETIKKKAARRKDIPDSVTLADKIRRTYILERDLFESVFCKGKFDYRPSPWWDGGRCKNVERKPIWPMIAKAVEKVKIEDPEDYVRYVFEIARIPPPIPNRAPPPNKLLGSNLIAEYQNGIASRRREKIQEARIDLHNMNAKYEHSQCWDSDANTFYEDENEKFAAGKNDSSMTEPWELYTDADMLENALLLPKDEQLHPLYRLCLVSRKCCLRDTWRDRFAGYFDHDVLGAAYMYSKNREGYDKVWGDFIPAALRMTAEIFNEAYCKRTLKGR